MYSRFPLEPLKILEEEVYKAIAEFLALLLVEQGAVNQVMAGFNPKLDAH